MGQSIIKKQRDVIERVLLPNPINVSLIQNSNIFWDFFRERPLFSFTHVLNSSFSAKQMFNSRTYFLKIDFQISDVLCLLVKFTGTKLKALHSLFSSQAVREGNRLK